MTGIVRVILVLFMVAHTPVSAWSQSQAPCFVSFLQGSVTLQRAEGKAGALQPFQWLLSGDVLLVDKGARIRLGFLRLGKTEEWQGPASLVIQGQGAHDQGGTQQPGITQLGGSTIAMRENSLLRTQGELTAGQFPVRSMPVNASLNTQQQERLQAIEQQYISMTSSLPPGDATPHMLYLIELEQLGQKATMAKCLRGLLELDGSNTELKTMLSRL